MNILKGLILTAALICNAYAEQVKVAVIDTGYTKHPAYNPVNLCVSGHFDATKGIETIGEDSDVRGIENHGTHIAHIIDDHLKVLGKDKYCLVIFKIYDNKKDVVEASIEVLKRIKDSNISYVNYSTAGSGYNAREDLAIKDLLNKGVRISAAAGNRAESLDLKKVYPAMYDSRIFVVGNGFNNENRFFYSNFGTPVKNWEKGTDISAGGYVKSGTSQSTAIFTAKMVYDSIKYGRQNSNKRK